MIKLVFCLRRRDDLSREEFQRYWREQHGPLVRSHAEALGIRRYVQVHSIDDEISLAIAGERGSPQPYDGVAELWFDDIEGANRAFNEPRYLEVVRPDELKFVDLERCVSMLTEEFAVI